MASRAHCFPGLLAWLLLLQPGLGEARTAPEATSRSPVPSAGGTEAPRASQQEAALSGMPGSPSSAPQPEGSAKFLDSEALTLGGSYSYQVLPTPLLPIQIGGNYTVSSPACGRRTTRIVGGRPSAERKWPWQVSLEVNSHHICGGSLIGKRWVLTAAHCIFGHVNYSVMLGTIHLNSKKSVRIPVEDIVMHQDFTMVRRLIHDIALVLLASPVPYSTHIQPVCLPEKAFMVQTGTECWVTGWGATAEKDSSKARPNRLQEVELNIVRYDRCNLMFKKRLGKLFDILREGTVCAYSERGGDSCKGDSGGPLVCEFNETWVQVGVVSWGYGCGHVELPGVYTEVSFYKDWVIKQMSRASCWDLPGFLILSLCLVMHLSILMTL